MERIKKVLSIILVAAALSFSACKNDSDNLVKEGAREKKTEKSQSTPESTVNKFLEAYVAVDTDEMLECCEDGDVFGIDEINEALEDHPKAYKSLRKHTEYEVGDIKTDDDKATADVTLRVPAASESDVKEIVNAPLEESEIEMSLEKIDDEWIITSIE